jgi:hypothetical protein
MVFLEGSRSVSTTLTDSGSEHVARALARDRRDQIARSTHIFLGLFDSGRDLGFVCE